MIVEAANKHGKTTAMRVTSSAQARRWKDAGALLLAYSADVAVLQAGYRRALREIKG